MVLAALEGRDYAGMRPIEVVGVIRQRWWATVRIKDINPVLWRLANKGRLQNTGGRYRLSRYGNGYGNGHGYRTDATDSVDE